MAGWLDGRVFGKPSSYPAIQLSSNLVLQGVQPGHVDCIAFARF